MLMNVYRADEIVVNAMPDGLVSMYAASSTVGPFSAAPIGIFLISSGAR
jgi:hypothetical protein